MVGSFWVFSGIDGAGKTTQIKLLIKYFQKSGNSSKRIWLRVGYTPSLDFLRKILRCVHPKILPPAGKSLERERRFSSNFLRTTWIIVSIIDFFIYVNVWLRILRLFGVNVVADRWIEDSELDLTINFPLDDPAKWILWRAVKIFSPKPRIHFVFVVPVEESLRRSIEKNEPFPDGRCVLQQRLFAYASLIKTRRVIEIDGLQPKIELHKKILDFCKAKL